MQVGGGGAGDGFFDNDAVHCWQGLAGLGGGDLIASDQDDGDAVMGGNQGVEGGFADDAPIDGYFPDGAWVIAMAENGVAGADRAMIAYKEDGIKGAIQPFHHVERLVLAGDIGGLSV